MWRLLALLCTVHFVRFWILPGRDGLWIDETGTYWTIAGGWHELWARTAIQPNSRLYGALLLGWTQVAGLSETALRLPSMAAMLTAVAVMAALLRRQLGAGAAWPVVVLCLASPEFSFFAIDARPYAFAVLLVVISSAAWVRLHEEMSWANAAAWAVSAGLLVHFHPVVAVALSAQMAWMLWWMDWRTLTPRRALAWCGLIAAAGLIALPEIVRMLPIVAGDNVSALPGTPAAANAFRAVIPFSILAPALLASLALLLLRKWKPIRLDGAARELAALAILLVALTLGLCGAYTFWAHNNLIFTRYLIAIYPGFFLLLGVLLARWTDEKGRLWFALAYSGLTLVLSVASQGWIPVHADADWRGAMAAVRQWEQDRPAPLLLQTGFVEGARANILRDPKWQEFLYAPALYYPHAGPTYVLPYRTQRNGQAYLDELASRVEGQRYAAVVYAAPGEMPRSLAFFVARDGQPRLLARVRRLAVYAFGSP
ncbi:MAG: glycosyltransferase family 39 protein [Acidobacteriota bacterium]